MGREYGPGLPPITPDEYQRMKQRVREKWEPKLRKLAKERARAERAAVAARAFTGIKPPFDQLHQKRLREIHDAICKEIDALPKPRGGTRPTPKRSPVLNKLPTKVRKYIEDSIGQKGLKVTDDVTLKWMGDVVSKPEDRMPGVRGAGVEYRW